MKAKKQERIIACATASVVGIAAMALFVSGLGNDGSKQEASNSSEVESEVVYGMTEQTTEEDLKLSMSNLNSNLVGSSSSLENTVEKETEEQTEEESVYMVNTEVAVNTITNAAEGLEELATTPYEYENTFIVNVDNYVNVRASATTDAEVVGKIYAGGGGTVVEKGAEWSKITSGNVSGYIKNEFAWFAEEAEAHFADVCTRYAVSNVDSLRVREEASTDSDVIAVVNVGAEVQVLSVEGDWAKVSYIGTEAYIFAEYLEMEYVIEDGITIEEEQEAIRLEQERIAAEERAAAEAEELRKQKLQQAIENSQLTETVQTSAYNVSEQDAYLLACVVSSEAGYESYEGKLAVANIVLNRLNGGAYGSTIYDVVYARGQFSVVTNGALNRAIENGPNAESIQAAKDALAGKNNVPNYTSFCSLGAANYDAYSQYSIICNQVFYRR